VAVVAPIASVAVVACLAVTEEGPGHVWVDERLLPAAGPHLSAFDRGFQLGDGVFETLRARAGRPTELTEHLDRLRRSAEGLSIELPADLAVRIPAAIEALLEAEDLGGPEGDASIRITVSRGVIRARGLLPSGAASRPTLVVQAWPVAPPPAGHLEHGLHLVPSSVRRDPSSPLAALKTTSRADYVHARLEARSLGADDALFLTIDGRLSEATSANIFILHDARLATPSLDCAVLPGTTRDWLLRWAPRAGLEAWQGALHTDDLLGADEAFLSSSVAGVLPVTRFAGSPIGDGRPGPVTRRARAEREAFIAGAPARP
jgi:branched-chain amino acid aminotransferase